MRSERFPLPMAEPCTSCGQLPGQEHEEECLLVEHQAMLAGDPTAQAIHDPEECWWCIDAQPPVLSNCRCGDCCRHKIIDVTLEDARREPKIREQCDPLFLPAELTASGKKELIGFLLNSKKNSYACAFLEQETNLCTIYGSRPLVCRLFDCEEDGEEE